jgi:protein SCO1/2
MQVGNTIRNKAWRQMAAFAVFALLGCGIAAAQVTSYGEKDLGDTSDELPKVLHTVAIQQRLNNPLPLDAQFTDETGKAVRLGDYFGKRPVILVQVYYECKMLCSEELKGLVGAIDMLSLRPGKDYDIVVVSIDPTEGPAQSAAAKKTYLARYGRPETAGGWHFLTGTQQNIDALCRSTGFGYVKIPAVEKGYEYAHASAIELITADGRISQYYLGVEYSPKDVLLGLVEASNNKVGTPVENILTYCYHYDPTKNHQTLIVARVVQLGGIATLAGLGGFMFLMFRRDLNLGRDHDGPDNAGGKNQNG